MATWRKKHPCSHKKTSFLPEKLRWHVRTCDMNFGRPLGKRSQNYPRRKVSRLTRNNARTLMSFSYHPNGGIGWHRKLHRTRPMVKQIAHLCHFASKDILQNVFSRAGHAKTVSIICDSITSILAIRFSDKEVQRTPSSRDRDILLGIHQQTF